MTRPLWILDVNGVLLDSSTVVKEAFLATAERFGAVPSAAELRQVSGLWLPEAYSLLVGHGDAVACARHHLQLMRERMLEIRAYENVVSTLELTKCAGGLIGAVTSYGEIAEACLVRTGLYRYIDCLVTQEEVVHPKPDPESLLRVLQLLMAPGERESSSLMYVGDTLVDVQAGRAANIPTVGVAYGMSDAATIVSAAPDYVIHDFSEMRQFLGLESAVTIA